MDKTAHLHAVDVSTVNGVVTARIVGPTVEEHRGAAILRTVRRAIENAGDSLRALVVDFGNVTFMNSTGLSTFIMLRNDLDEREIRTIAYRPSDDLRGLFRNAKIDKLFEIVELPEGLP